ncbi:SIR2 family protein [Xanthomonas campestris pv. zinniae]|uniref:SIR2 family protein n=1 Tax=Xanthomonas cannabis TaxID=1885674 RepID=UPI001E37A985|nr:SIR2 family protein [Xanthomonas campestris pv. zinniae]
MKHEHQKLVDRLYKELSSGNLGIFAGAGFSQSAGYVNWKELLRPIALDLDLDIDLETDLVAVAQYHLTKYQSRNKINHELVEAFSRQKVPTDNHRILARLPISTYWTTNYDHLIEKSLEDAHKVVDVKYTLQHLPVTKYKRDAVVYKMHGDVDHPNEAVLTRDDYERYHLKMAPYIDALKGDLISKTLLFLGFSFTDPNLDYILSRVRVVYEENRRHSECILRRVSREKDEALEQFEYRQRKQALFEKELIRYGITVTYVDDFGEITEILRALEQKYRHQSIFISGAAHDYTPLSDKESEKFVFDLAAELSRRQKRILSGFGLGIGSAVIAGVVEATAREGKALDEDRLLVRPFPQTDSGAMNIRELWTLYRDDILKRAGIAIFLFGNKLEKGSVVLSNGMREEFELALANKVFPIPVGYTGGMAKELWIELIKMLESGSFKTTADIKSLIEQLGDDSKSLDQIRETILNLISII